MDDAKLSDFSLPENTLQPLLTASNLPTIDKALEHLIQIAKTVNGRLDLASKSITSHVLQLCQALSYPSDRHLLLLSLKLLRNLCAGEIRNQNTFIQENGVGVVLSIFSGHGLSSGSDYEVIRMGLQVLGNFSLAGEEHRHSVWCRLFPLEFLKIARIRSMETCDPLCMVIYTCCEGSHERFADLCADQGSNIMSEIIRSASYVGFKEEWLKLLLSRICLEESHLSVLFSKLSLTNSNCFVPEQAFLLSILSEIFNERTQNITISSEFAASVFTIFKKAVTVSDSTSTDVLEHSLTILRDICASDDLVDAVNNLVLSGLLELLLTLLQELEPPAIIKKTMKTGEENVKKKSCPYRGFRRDLVAVIGNCAYKRAHVQDEIRQKNGILLLLQQCVVDEENPFLREWGIWAVRNLLERNVENQRAVSELEIQGSVDVPEIASLGLKVEVDQETKRARLVNVG